MPDVVSLKKYGLFLVTFLLLFIPADAQKDSVLSGVYNWKKPVATQEKNIHSVILLEGKVHDMEWLQLSVNELAVTAESKQLSVPDNEEHLYIIKSGILNVVISDTINHLSPGSIALLMPGQQFWTQNKNNASCEYYVMKYRSNSLVDKVRGQKAGGSVVWEWDKIQFRPHNRGGIRNYYERATAMCKRMEMHVTTLNGGIKSHETHTHRAEEIVLMIEGNTEMQIGKQFYKGKKGSVYYLGSNVLHAIRNEGSEPCIYFAFQFE